MPRQMHSNAYDAHHWSYNLPPPQDHWTIHSSCLPKNWLPQL